MNPLKNVPAVKGSCLWQQAEDYLNLSDKSYEVQSVEGRDIKVVTSTSPSGWSTKIFKALSYATVVVPLAALAIRQNFRNKYTFTELQLPEVDKLKRIPVWILCPNRTKNQEALAIKKSFSEDTYDAQIRVMDICGPSPELKKELESRFANSESTQKLPIIAVVLRAGGGHHAFGSEGEYPAETRKYLLSLPARMRIYTVATERKSLPDDSASPDTKFKTISILYQSKILEKRVLNIHSKIFEKKT